MDGLSTIMTEINTIFEGLDSREVDYVQARACTNSDAEALRETGFSRGWLNNHDKDDLNERAMAFKTDNVLKAQIILDEHLVEAVEGLVELLKSRNENVRLRAQQEFMDRRLGKAVQKIDQKTEHSGEVKQKQYVTFSPDDWDEDKDDE